MRPAVVHRRWSGDALSFDRASPSRRAGRPVDQAGRPAAEFLDEAL